MLVVESWATPDATQGLFNDAPGGTRGTCIRGAQLGLSTCKSCTYLPKHLSGPCNQVLRQSGKTFLNETSLSTVKYTESHKQTALSAVPGKGQTKKLACQCQCIVLRVSLRKAKCFYSYIKSSMWNQNEVLTKANFLLRIICSTSDDSLWKR